MNKKGVFALWGVAILMSIGAAGLTFMKTSSVSDFSCQGEVVVIPIGHKTKMASSIKFNFTDGNGRYDSNATVTQTGVPDQSFSNTIYFKYWREGDETVMLSDSNNALSETLKPLLDIPDFFLYRDRGIALKILKINRNSFMFTHDDTPIFYCKSKD
ncbi:hypothetical protein SOASR030_07950 [Leminorella grimontii]|uniref:FidL-like membrane protein n=1 Tax=Leminorella grimontii TaxID=82981 RepID=A0AAV5N192_9GAMM|nr:hypothetical protein [Leminorella grimontii]KFC96131.1 hypothetical protein GLGR_1305 [Leminorella grimontii ATCC 33999 = DSM 5078]GKX54683.1 hypothetical protein SOASR030_07950 [Leminorella grimontii]VFS58662.1 Uncharacterised protein [Leminorella grimontii]